MFLKIAQFADSYSPVADGVVTVIKNYAYWLNKKYGTCSVYCPTTPGYQHDDPFEVESFFSVPIPNRNPYRIGIPSLDPQFQKYLNNTTLDLVHAHAPFLVGNEAVRYGKKNNVPVVATFHSKYYDDFYAYTKSQTLANQGVQMIMSFYNKVDSVWTVSNSTVETIREYGYEGNVTVIPNGNDLTPLDDIPLAKANVNQRYGLKEDEPVFLFVGQHDWKKNIQLIIDGVHLFQKEHPVFKILMVGEGFAKEEIQASVEELGLSSHFVFTGLISDRTHLSEVMHRADALLFPSVYDNAPLVVKEAAALGCPSVLVRGSNAAENVIDQQNGFLCENTPQSLSDVIAYISTHPAQAKLAGQHAMETLPLSWESIVTQVYEQYRVVLDNYYSKNS